MQIGLQPKPWGLKEPYHDEEVIDETSAPATTVITFKLNGVTVGTKTITVSGAITTILVEVS